MKYLTEEILKYRNDLCELNHFKGQKYLHVHTDNIMRWEENLKKEKNNTSIQYYIKYPIEYRLNNEGFRTLDDFNSEDEGNVYLGCSHTFGIGHHLENVWTYKLNKIIGGKFWNMGVGGSGVMTHFRLFLAYYKELKIKNVFHYAPMYPRYEFIENGEPNYYIMGECNDKWELKFGTLLRECLMTDEQNEINWLAHTNAIRGLVNEIGAKYYLIGGETGLHHKNDLSLQARDLTHHTSLRQHKIYEDFLKIYDMDLYEKYKDEQLPITDIKTYMKKYHTSII
jgi:hypothetical protein